MEDNPLQKFADAYEEYRKRQRKKNLMTLLGTLGLGAAGLWGLSRFRGAQARRLAQQMAKRRRLLGGGAALAGLGLAAPFVLGGGGDDGGIADQLSMLPDSIRSLLGGGASLGLRGLFGGGEGEDSGGNIISSMANIGRLPGMSQAANLFQRAQEGESSGDEGGFMRGTISNLFDKIM